MRTPFLALSILLASNSVFSQSNFYHENLYKYLQKDIAVVKNDIRKQGALKLVSRWKEGQDSTSLLYRLKGHDIFYTFFVVNNKCSYIGASDRTSTPEETIDAFRKKYSELTVNDDPGYLQDYHTRERLPTAYFEDGSTNIGFRILNDRRHGNESLVYFYSRFMVKNL